MPGSVYKVIELVGTSTESWEAAARTALEAAAERIQDLRVAEVVTQDVRLKDNKVVEYRVKMNVSFKYHAELND
jgi:dodecin